MQSVFSTKSMKEKRATLFWEETPNAFNTKAYIVPSKGSPGSAFRLVLYAGKRTTTASFASSFAKAAAAKTDDVVLVFERRRRRS